MPPICRKNLQIPANCHPTARSLLFQPHRSVTTHRPGLEGVQPCHPVVIAETGPDGAHSFARSVCDLSEGIVGQIVGHEEPDPAGVAILNHRWIAAGVFAIAPHHPHRLPAQAAIQAPPQHHIDIPVVAPTVLPAFRKRQQHPGLRFPKRRNAVGVVALFAGREDHLLE